MEILLSTHATLLVLVEIGQYKLSSWLAIIFCAQSLANMRNVENDLKQISMAMMFAIMGLVTNYLSPARPGTKS
uniref:Protein Asterix n=1 Tax=Cucumis melo TaxID=3656 RepID=A0A9I9DFE6_CUCME